MRGSRAPVARCRRPADELPLLGKVGADQYASYGGGLTASGPPCRAFFSENERVRRGTEAWCSGDLAAFGTLVTESGESSIANYECRSPALIDLFHLLIATPGVYGAGLAGRFPRLLPRSRRARPR